MSLADYPKQHFDGSLHHTYVITINAFCLSGKHIAKMSANLTFRVKAPVIYNMPQVKDLIYVQQYFDTN